MEGASRRLAEFAVRSTPGPAAIESARAALRSAAELGRTSTFESPEVRPALTAARECWGADPLPAPWQAFLGGVGTGAAEVAAGLAMGELLAADEQAVLEAVATGLEAGRRVEEALATSPARRAWPLASVSAWVGAAATAGRLAGLDVDRMLAALALACTQAAAIDPGGDRNLQHGKAAFDGVEAVLLAEGGFTAPENPLEGRRGLVALMAPGADLTGV